VVDERDVIIVGHTRYKAAVKLGLAEVPVHVARGLTPAQANATRMVATPMASSLDFRRSSQTITGARGNRKVAKYGTTSEMSLRVWRAVSPTTVVRTPVASHAMMAVRR